MKFLRNRSKTHCFGHDKDYFGHDKTTFGHDMLKHLLLVVRICSSTILISAKGRDGYYQQQDYHL